MRYGLAYIVRHVIQRTADVARHVMQHIVIPRVLSHTASNILALGSNTASYLNDGIHLIYWLLFPSLLVLCGILWYMI